MLRMRQENGWRLVTHPDHAHLAGAFAAAWGNEVFARPEPRNDVLDGIHCHDDGWLARDAMPQITREGRPSAFSIELVEKYAAFEEIDMADYLAVRGQALDIIARRNRYAAVLVSMHTCDLLTTRADRSTIKTSDLPILDRFLEDQLATQGDLLAKLIDEVNYAPGLLSKNSFLQNFQLLQACDRLSLLTCVDYPQPASLLHALPTHGGDVQPVQARQRSPGIFELSPFPFRGSEVSFQYPHRFVAGEFFPSAGHLQAAFNAAPLEQGEVVFVKG